ncbi:MAG: hypothetical protein AAFV80_16135 [Bacteroidota bacterium]
MQNISSSATLALKFFIPTIWIVFFGTITLYVCLSNNAAEMVGGTEGSVLGPRLSLLIFFFSGVAFFLFLFMRLKRVEVDQQFVYVTNYLKIYKYPYSNIERVERRRILFFRPATIHFKQPGSFGSKVTFLEGRKFDRLMIESPETVAPFLQMIDASEH